MKINADILQMQHEKKLRQLAESHENEVKKIGKSQNAQTAQQLEAIERAKVNHQKMMESLKNDQDQQYHTQISKSDEKIMDDLNRKHTILEENKKFIDEDNTRLDNELVKTRQLYKDQLENFKTDQELLSQQKHEDFNLEASKFNDSSRAQMKTIKDKYKQQTSQVANQSIQDYGSYVADSEKKAIVQKQNFQSDFDKKGFEYNSKLLQQEVELQKELNNVNKQNKQVHDQTILKHQGELASETVQHQSHLSKEQESFANRKNMLVTSSEAELNTIKNAYAKELSKMREAFSKEKNQIASRAEDDFYSITTLTPTISEQLEGYVVSLPLPKHESENVIFTGHQRNLKLSVARTFSDDVTLADGSQNVSKKSESVSKSFKVADIIDPKQITRKYEDGVLSFYIKKA